MGVAWAHSKEVLEVKPDLPAKIDKQQARELYRKIAPRYDLWARLTESRARTRCLELASIQDREAVLELAVGTGLAFVEILKSNPNGRNEGLDLSREMLDRAVLRAESSGLDNFRLYVGDAYDLDYPDSSFDVVVNNYMFDLLPEPDFPIVLREFYRVLRPGGRLVLVNMTAGKRWFGRVWEAIYRISPAWLGGCRGVHLRPHVEAIGFADTRREYISQMTFPSEIIFGVKPRG
jgi:ubiquinone/menaquinone biosynthesis C-methylase UbiE